MLPAPREERPSYLEFLLNFYGPRPFNCENST
jgi:hypothetical protein